MDENGIILEQLEQCVKERLSIRPRETEGRKSFWSMLYLIPTFHNPTGLCLSQGMLCCILCANCFSSQSFLFNF